MRYCKVRLVLGPELRNHRSMDSGSDLAFSAVSIFHSEFSKREFEPFKLKG